MGYKDHAAYQWYLNKEGKTRRQNLPAFETYEDEDGVTVVRVAPGEVYCRFNITGKNNEANCSKLDPFSSETNLKNHIKKHRVKGQAVRVKGKRTGANSVDDDAATLSFYTKMKGKIFGTLDSDDEADIEAAMATPKKPVGVSKAQKKRDAPALFKLPVTKNSKNRHAKLGEMRKMADFKGSKKCTNCLRLKRAKCPPKFRPSADPEKCCEVWDCFAVHPIENKLLDKEGLEEQDQDQDSEDSGLPEDPVIPEVAREAVPEPVVE